MIDHELIVQIDRGPRADLDDPQVVPLAERLVGQHERVPARGVESIVEEPARALVRPAAAAGPAFGGIPDLDLRRATEIDSTIALGDRLVVDQELDIAEFLVGREVGAIAIVHQLAVRDAPMLPGIRGLIGELPGAFLRTHRRKLARVELFHTMPVREILAVEQGDEPFGRFIHPLLGKCPGGAEQHGGRKGDGHEGGIAVMHERGPVAGAGKRG